MSNIKQKLTLDPVIITLGGLIHACARIFLAHSRAQVFALEAMRPGVLHRIAVGTLLNLKYHVL